MKVKSSVFILSLLCISKVVSASDRMALHRRNAKPPLNDGYFIFKSSAFGDEVDDGSDVEINVIDEAKYLRENSIISASDWGSEVDVIDEDVYLSQSKYSNDNIWGSEINVIDEKDYLYIDWFKNKYKKKIALKNTDVAGEQEIIVLDDAKSVSKDSPVVMISKPVPVKGEVKKAKRQQKVKDTFSDEDVVILSVKLKKYFLTDSLVAYLDGRDVFVPLGEFFQTLLFPIDVNDDENMANGFFLSKERKFELDLSKKYVMSDNKRFTISDNDVKNIDGVLYVRHSELSKWFPLDIKFRLNDLMLDVESAELMPIEIQKDREQRRKFVDIDKKKVRKTDRDVIEIKDEFSVPSFDLSLSQSFNKTGENSTSSTNYYLNVSNIIFGYDTSWYLYGSDSDNAKLRVKAQKYQPFNSDAFLKDVEFGDVNSSYIPLISNSSMGRGIYFSSLTDSRVSGSRTVNISGFLADGYEVELYKDGHIIDFITSSQNGMYEFRDVPVVVGLNVFTIKFISPYGEQREEEKRIYVSASLVGSGEFELTGSLTQDSNVLFDLDDENKDASNNDVKLNLEGIYGISSSVALSLGFSRQNEVVDKDVIGNYISAGLHFGLPFGSVSTYWAENMDNAKNAYSFSMTNQIWGWTVFSKYDEYNGIHSAPSYFSGEYADDMMEFRLNGRFGIPYIGSVPTYLRYRKYSLYDDEVFETLYADEKVLRFSYPLKKLNLGLEYNSTSLFNGSEISDVSLKGIYKVGIANLKTEYIYNTKPNKSSSMFSLRSDFKADKYLSYYTEWQHSYLSDVDNLLFGISKKTDIGSFSLGVSFASSSDRAILLSYNIGLLANQKSLGYYPDGYNNITSTGAMKLRTFLDRNANNLFDDGDELLENVRVQASSSNGGKQFTDANGELLVSGMPSADLTTVKVNTDKLDDISFVPVMEEFAIIPRNGYCQNIDIPIIQVSEVEGVVLEEKRKKLLPMKGIVIKIVDEDGVEVKRAVSESDGSFIISRLAYGKYRVVVDGEQLKSFKFKPVKDIELVVDEPFEYVDTIKLKK